MNTIDRDATTEALLEARRIVLGTHTHEGLRAARTLEDLIETDPRRDLDPRSVRFGGPLKLGLTPWTKARTRTKIRENLEDCPDQRPDSPEACGGLVMEFNTVESVSNTDSRPGCGTLSEFHDKLGINEATILAFDGRLTVHRDPNGDWHAADTVR